MLGLLDLYIYVCVFLYFFWNVIMQFFTFVFYFGNFGCQIFLFGLFHLCAVIFFFMPICQILISELWLTKSTFDFWFFRMQSLDMPFDQNFLHRFKTTGSAFIGYLSFSYVVFIFFSYLRIHFGDCDTRFLFFWCLWFFHFCWNLLFDFFGILR